MPRQRGGGARISSAAAPGALGGPGRLGLRGPLAGAVAGYPKGFLESVDTAMSVVPAARFQTAHAWTQSLPQPVQSSDRKVVLLRRVAPPPLTPRESLAPTSRACAGSAVSPGAGWSTA